MRRVGAITIGGAFLLLSLAASAQASTTEVTANGNAFTGGLSFMPASINVRVGDTVRWRNTDFLVPHTATEDHGLWDLGGSYGGTPANPPGFGPGTTVQRVFEAGTQAYYCRVHPRQMHGTIRVPVSLSIARKRVRVRVRHRRPHHRRYRIKIRRYVVVVWSSTRPTAGLGFDVERRQAGGRWRVIRTATTGTRLRFRIVRRNRVWQLRARLRRSGSAAAASGWSPLASIRS